MSVAEQVKAIIVEQLGVDTSEVTDQASFTDDLGADSLDVAELVMAVEDKFYISLDETELKNIVTVGQAIAYIQNKIEG